MTENDPTDNALAAIAKILDRPETSADLPHTAAPEVAEQPEIKLAEEILAAPSSAPPPAIVPADVDAEPDDAKPDDAEPAHAAISDTADGTYTKYGPGPLAAIRFKWVARRGDDGSYFVDETIGENSHPLVSGPMTREAAIKFVDDHESQARQRFEALRSEMAGGEIGRRSDAHS